MGQLTQEAVKMKTIFLLQVLFHACFAQRSNLDFTNAYTDPDSGALCIKQEVCIPNLEALAKNLPAGPCIPSDEGCNCLSDADCQLNGGTTARCVACKCMDCPVSAASSGVVINPPLTFLIDTTRSVKPDKDSIFNLTQRVVDRIQETNTNIPQYQLVTFNDYGPDITRNVEVREPTEDLNRFKQEILGLEFESFDGGRDSKERLLQGLLIACKETPPKSLIVVFTDNGSKDLNLKKDIMRIEKEKDLQVFIVLTPVYEGWPNDKSLLVFDEVAEVFFINEVGADAFLGKVEEFEEGNCL